MADSDALRQRRRRQHVAGNHALCRRDCGKNQPVLRSLPEVREDAAGSAEFNPAARMRELAEQMREACAANPGDAMLAREYRLTLQALTPEKKADDDLAGLLASMQR
jgi:hypothetical protein